MADTFIVSAARKQVWDANWIAEYQRASQFRDYMREDDNAPIQVDRALMREAGEVKNVTLRTKLTGPGVSGNTTLEGQEESLDNYNDQATVEWERHGVLVTKKEESVTELDVRDGGKNGLKDWRVEKDRDQIIETLESPVVGGLTAYADVSEANKDTWLVANQDRILFGGGVGNYSGDHSADLAKLDATNDKFTATNLRLARRRLKLASPAIRPIKIDGKGEWWIAFSPSNAFRDFKSSMDTTHQNAHVRGMGNPLYHDGDLVFDNIIVKEVPEMSIIADVGDSGTVDVGIVTILGAQAVLAVYKQMPKLIVDPNRDYQFRYGVAIESAHKFKKAFFNSVQHGVFTHYVAAEPDA